MAYATTNPYTNEVVKTFPDATDAEVDAALDTAHAAFLSWRTTSFSGRSKVLLQAADLMRERRDELARLNTLEMGKLFRESLWEIELTLSLFAYYAKNGEHLLAPEPLQVDDPNAGDAMLVYQPLGIVFEIEPWNGPLFQAVRPLAAQLMAGNVVILKHASNVPQSAAAIETLMKDAGLPDGVFTNLYATHAQADRIIADPRVCGVTLTGSEAAGARVAAQAGGYVKKSVLELGGSDAMIVLADADLNQVVQCAMLGRLSASGQACISAKRMIIAGSLYDEFVFGVTATMQSLHPGDPMDPNTTLAPVSSQAAADTVASLPFGGTKRSGYGREMGAAGIREFVNQKVINGARVAEVA